MKRGPKPGTGGRPKKAVQTVKVTVQMTETAKANIYDQAASQGMNPGKWLSKMHEPP